MFRRRPPLPPFPPGAWLVGGAARDVLLGQVPRDYDWLTPDPGGAARALAEGSGGSVFALDPERDYWRVYPSGGPHHDFVPLPPGGLVADLQRRDYTVNALALGPGGEVTDPTGGQADLRARRLRLVSRENLRADPLRAWRGVRLEQGLRLRLTPDSEAALREVGPALAAGEWPTPAPERLRDELHLLLALPGAAQALARLHALGLLAPILPELSACEGVGQGGFHHLDVLGHSLEALHQLLARHPEAGLPLRWATLLHDIGKPPTESRDPQTGRRRFYGHDALGAELAAARLEGLRLPRAEVSRVSALIRAHMAPLPATDPEARRFVHRRRELLPDLLSLMLADREAARGPSSSPASRHAYALGFERVLAALEERPTAPPPLLRGEEVMALLGLPPGPGVGAALRALAEAQALGEVRTPEEARNWLLAQPGLALG